MGLPAFEQWQPPPPPAPPTFESVTGGTDTAPTPPPPPPAALVPGPHELRHLSTLTSGEFGSTGDGSRRVQQPQSPLGGLASIGGVGGSSLLPAYSEPPPPPLFPHVSAAAAPCPPLLRPGQTQYLLEVGAEVRPGDGGGWERLGLCIGGTLPPPLPLIAVPSLPGSDDGAEN